VFITGVKDTGDKTVATVPACLHLKVKINKENHSVRVNSIKTASKKQ
jgi:hypothetical protein